MVLLVNDPGFCSICSILYCSSTECFMYLTALDNGVFSVLVLILKPSESTVLYVFITNSVH